MESVIALLTSILTMPHCTVAPLSAAVVFSMVIMDGFGPDELSGDVILSNLALRASPKALTVPTLGSVPIRH